MKIEYFYDTSNLKKLETKENMKKITQLLTALVVSSLMIFISCGGGGNDDGGTTDPRIEIGNNLVTVVTGNPATIKLDGADRTEWAGFSLTFTFNGTDGGSYSVSGVPDNAGSAAVWGEQADKTWTFDTDGGIILRSDNVDMTAAITSASASLTFDITGSAGRASAFDGTWVFTW
ncbi:MAG: hypothetical protein ACJA08_002482 [Cyclobacteriaceae bacterium]